ncbi:potassium/proton-divalent cation antiporter [Exiguobacterium sp. 8H]|uniref:cation diffusion facilitator family transporter n=1 Tax=Exiguobacterium TaxID=33986 RepID=UPI0012F38EC3|nr:MULTISPECIES: cation diffusion facilitator family transporter [Exiguobacterium]VXA94122.1 potassium/proton-divalent cation antiporter [Exiguobacterium sp. 8H]VXB90841.1 potassium/proton-divalent cation antiporter [Exiguobacterium sp. 8A]
MGHHHDHDHHHHHSTNQRALLLAFLLIAAFMVVEVIGGLWTNSLALLSDAGHMLGDAAALGLSFLAVRFGAKAATPNRTFGYRRFEILAAFINGLTLLVISVYILVEAYQRISAPPEILSGGMLVVAIIGLLVNILAAWILMRGEKDNLNVKSALLHVFGDLLGSVGAITAAILIMLFGWTWADPVASAFVAILILISGYRVTRDAIHILMEGSPEQIDVRAMQEEISKVEGVKEVHDLHVWSISSSEHAATCHVLIGEETDDQDVLRQVTERIRKYGTFERSTVQIERERQCCEERIIW